MHKHPEGGYYQEIFCSASRVQPGDHRAERSTANGNPFSVGGGSGFDFSDFRMAKDDAEMRRIITLQGEAFAACL